MSSSRQLDPFERECVRLPLRVLEVISILSSGLSALVHHRAHLRKGVGLRATTVDYAVTIGADDGKVVLRIKRGWASDKLGEGRAL